MSVLLIGFMRFVALLPLSWVRALGHAVGWLLWTLVPSRRRIVQTNLRLCFPDKTELQIKAMARAHFVQFAQSLIDRAWLWHAPLAKVSTRLK